MANKRLTITQADIDHDWEMVGCSKQQCRAVHERVSSGIRRVTFCSRPAGHDGDHRGYRAQWPQHKEGDK